MNDQLKAQDLRSRTKQFALRIIRLYSVLARAGASQVIGRQMLRSGTSVGAQYREACRARSAAEFVSKMESASQELDETIYWLELLIEGGLVKQGRLDALLREANELTAIFVASSKTTKKGKR
ncbi:MAG: four helix bundle protein [Tepidisphaeraceae bacterium]